MQGSVYHGYGQNSKPAREYNVERDLPDAKAVLSAPWKNIAITPLDTCSVVCLAGDNFAQLKKSDDPLIKALLQNTMGDKITDPAQLTHSGTLFDDVAVYMADTTNNHSLLHYDRLKIAVADNGFTVISPQGVDMDVATTWTDRNGFYDYYLGMLLGHGP
jgi:inosine-uridine nucleoside N-ribohydrolase